MKKPITIIDEFISPLRCRSLNVIDIVNQKVPQIIPIIEQYYDISIADHTPAVILNEYRHICDNSIYRNKWIRINNYDFTGYIPLSTFNNKPPFDIETDVYGGSLVFPSFKYKIDPEMGRLLIFPSVPNFSHYHEPVKIGVLEYIKFFFTCDTPFVYDLTQWNNKL